jgi:hypothetical protein
MQGFDARVILNETSNPSVILNTLQILLAVHALSRNRLLGLPNINCNVHNRKPENCRAYLLLAKPPATLALSDLRGAIETTHSRFVIATSR